MSNPKLPAISPRKMQTPNAPLNSPVVKSMPGAPEKNMGAKYPLPSLAKLDKHSDSVVRSLDNEFILALPEEAMPNANEKPNSQKFTLPAIPRLTLPEGKFIEPENNETGCLAPRKEEDEAAAHAEWFEQQVEEFKQWCKDDLYSRY